MRVYKAIQYDGIGPTVMSSKFTGDYKPGSCWENLIKTAFSHVSHGDKKTVKDYKKNPLLN